MTVGRRDKTSGRRGLFKIHQVGVNLEYFLSIFCSNRISFMINITQHILQSYQMCILFLQ